MKYFFFPDSCFFCYAQNIHILTRRSGKCSAYVLKYNFCTVFCVIEKHLAAMVDVEETDEKRKLVEVDVKLQGLVQETSTTYTYNRTYSRTYNRTYNKERGMPKCRQAWFCYNKSPDLEGSWCLVGNLGSVQLEGPLVGSYRHSEAG